MTIIKTHNGKWSSEDLIEPLSSNDQRLDLAPGSSFVSYLGIDTEFLVEKEESTVWPWEANLPQERVPNSKVTGHGDGDFDFHGDGYATELCTKPNYCLEQLLGSLGRAFNWAYYALGSKITAPALYDIPEEVEKAAPDEAKRLGCMPSINVYGDAGAPGSLSSRQRTTGCHLHISHPALQVQDTAMALIKWADILVGCTWTYISPNPSKAEAERRKAYGRAGEYRLKIYPTYPATTLEKEYSHGVEYRVLPGTVIQHPAYVTLMFSLYRSALRLAYKYGEPVEELSLQAKEVINSSNKVEAKKVIRSLPISDGGRKLIRYMRRVPLSLPSLNQWYRLGGMYSAGHSVLFDQKVRNREFLSI